MNHFKEKNRKSIDRFWRKLGFQKLASAKTNKQTILIPLSISNFSPKLVYRFSIFFFEMIHHTIEHKTRHSLIFDPHLYDSLNFGTL